MPCVTSEGAKWCRWADTCIRRLVGRKLISLMPMKWIGKLLQRSMSKRGYKIFREGGWWSSKSDNRWRASSAMGFSSNLQFECNKNFTGKINNNKASIELLTYSSVCVCCLQRAATCCIKHWFFPHVIVQQLSLFVPFPVFMPLPLVGDVMNWLSLPFSDYLPMAGDVMNGLQICHKLN